ncbi:hypothetical protein SUGI_1301540, partial [Cryptomeria japonica]
MYATKSGGGMQSGVAST